MALLETKDKTANSTKLLPSKVFCDSPDAFLKFLFLREQIN